MGAILDGRKTSTTSLVVQYTLDDEPLPVVGERGVVVDSSGRPVCNTEVTDVRVMPLGTVVIAVMQPQSVVRFPIAIGPTAHAHPLIVQPAYQRAAPGSIMASDLA